ncbi:Uncharacterised protein [Legionella pneumophila]|nr:Uncharacterised protein [Legionella pneumophila]
MRAGNSAEDKTGTVSIKPPIRTMGQINWLIKRIIV